ncbi:MAG: HNH endonuclease [Bacteroidota bacterium]
MYKFYATLFDAFNYYLNSESDEALQDFLSSVNRTSEMSEAALKGVAFNELIDSINNGNPEVPCDNENIFYKVFSYPIKIVNEFCDYFKGAAQQIYVSAEIETKFGTVEVYGYLDELRMDCCYDIKTTSNYTFPKFIDKYQHLIYPYCLNNRGSEINTFEYTITDFKDIYKEVYTYNHDRDSQKIKLACEQLIEFIERPEIKSQITNQKIYGLISSEINHN